jgi:hypothetical protein
MRVRFEECDNLDEIQRSLYHRTTHHLQYMKAVISITRYSIRHALDMSLTL